MEREALKQALEALEQWNTPLYRRGTAITAIKEALAQPAQEPVAWTTMPESEDWCFVSGNKDPNGKLDGKWFPLYTAPPQRTWVGLTDEDIGQWIEEEHDVLRWAEAKLKEKNT